MGDAVNYQYLPPSGEGYEPTGAYYQPASSNSGFMLPPMSNDDGYPQDSRVHPQGSYSDVQQALSDYGRDKLGSWNGFQHMSFTQLAPRQRAAIACRYCRRRKVRSFSFLSSNMRKHIWFWAFFSGHEKKDFESYEKLSMRGRRHLVMTALPVWKTSLSQPASLLAARWIPVNIIPRLDALDPETTLRDVAQTASDSNRNAFSCLFLARHKPSFQLTWHSLTCEIWVLIRTELFIYCLPISSNSMAHKGSLCVKFHLRQLTRRLIL